MTRKEIRCASRRPAADFSANLSETTIISASLLAFVLTGLVGWYLTSSLTRQIGSAAALLQSSSGELQAAANLQSSGSTGQATAVNEIATTINELLSTSRLIAENAQRVAKVAQETSLTASRGDETVQRTTQSIAGIKTQVDVVVVHVLELGKKSQLIGSITEMINELAEQTNILAINATIEAAGAGEWGKRFAVVADEIRKLADRVSVSSSEIRQSVGQHPRFGQLYYCGYPGRFQAGRCGRARVCRSGSALQADRRPGQHRQRSGARNRVEHRTAGQRG